MGFDENIWDAKRLIFESVELFNSISRLDNSKDLDSELFNWRIDNY